MNPIRFTQLPDIRVTYLYTRGSYEANPDTTAYICNMLYYVYSHFFDIHAQRNIYPACDHPCLWHNTDCRQTLTCSSDSYPCRHIYSVLYDSCFYLNRRPVCYTAPIGILAIILATTKFSVETLLLICVLCLCSMLYGYLTTELATLHQQMKHLTDTSETNELLAKERIRMIRKEQDNRIYTATLKERNRIAREIHDNVGHMLTRSILQVGAIQTINKEPILTNPLSDLRTTLDTAMNSIRSSVHDLHDESIDMEAAIQDMLNDITGFHTSFEYDMSNIVPKDIKYCLISIAKEAITNAVKHSNGDQLSILIREHPGFYQLTIHDNGTDIHLTDTPGIGLTNIRERVQSLSGTLQITTNSGFRLFVSIPKHTQKGDRTA